MVAQLRGRVAVLFAEGAGEILFIRKAAQKGDLLDGVLVFDQQLQRLVHAQLDDILLG